MGARKGFQAKGWGKYGNSKGNKGKGKGKRYMCSVEEGSYATMKEDDIDCHGQGDWGWGSADNQFSSMAVMPDMGSPWHAGPNPDWMQGQEGVAWGGM